MLESTANTGTLNGTDLYDRMQHCQTFHTHPNEERPAMTIGNKPVGTITSPRTTIMMILPPDVSNVSKSGTAAVPISPLSGYIDHQSMNSLPLSPSITPPIVLSPISSSSLSPVVKQMTSEDNICDDLNINSATTLLNNQNKCQIPDASSSCDSKKTHCSKSDYQADRVVFEQSLNGYVQRSSNLLLRPCTSDSQPGQLPIGIGSTTRLHIDTNLANMQSARQQEESYQNKTLLAQKILSMIRNNDFEQFSSILRCSKPDLNVFINGQTALHYCLLLGRDVSWCKLLVLNGANPNLSNQDGWHPLHLATFRGLKESVHYLISCNNSCQSHQLNGLEPTTSTASDLG